VSRRSVPEGSVDEEARPPVHQAPVYIFVRPSWRGRLDILVLIIHGGGNVDDEGWEKRPDRVRGSVRRHGPRFLREALSIPHRLPGVRSILVNC
jgi:hypothetical protein